YPLDSNAIDMSENGYNGTVYNCLSAPDHFGNPDGALDFSGSGSYIDLPLSNYLLNEYTYSVWCKPRTVPFTGNAYAVISIGGDIADQSIMMGNINYSIFGAGSYDASFAGHPCNSAAPAPVDQWYPLVFERNDTMIQF